MRKKMIHNIKDFLTDSLYYPACGVDWEVIKYCNEHYDQLGINKFIYADYWIGETMLKNNLESFSEYPLGYNLIESHSVSPSVLGFDLSLIPECGEVDKEHILWWRKKAYARYAVFEKDPYWEHGPDRFSLLFLCAEGIAVYENLYLANNIIPKAIAIIQPGTAFGGNWTDFNDPDGPFAKVVKKGNSLPKYFFSGGARGSRNVDYIWNGYRPILDFHHKQDESVTLWQQL